MCDQDYITKCEMVIKRKQLYLLSMNNKNGAVAIAIGTLDNDMTEM